MEQRNRIAEILRMLINDPVIKGMACRICDCAHQEGRPDSYQLAVDALRFMPRKADKRKARR